MSWRKVLTNPGREFTIPPETCKLADSVESLIPFPKIVMWNGEPEPEVTLIGWVNSAKEAGIITGREWERLRYGIGAATR